MIKIKAPKTALAGAAKGRYKDLHLFVFLHRNLLIKNIKTPVAEPMTKQNIKREGSLFQTKSPIYKTLPPHVPASQPKLAIKMRSNIITISAR